MTAGSALRQGDPSRTPLKTITHLENFGQLLEQLGDISPERVRLEPSPGQARKKDLVRLLERDHVLCELVDGTLVEKVVGQVESLLASWLIYCFWNYLEKHDKGRVFAPDAPFELQNRLIRMPDVSFVSYERLPKGVARTKPVATWIPELAVEIISKGNSKKEIDRKLRDYFVAGVVLVWIVDPRKKTVKVHTSAESSVTLGLDDKVDGGVVLPGFELSIHEWFAKAE